MTSFDTQHLRNVALLSHSGTGKTSIVEALLFATGAITRLGRVEDGTTTSDHEPEEIKRGSSIQTSVVPCNWRDYKLNLLDTPGYPDFVGEPTSALRAVEAAVLVVAAQAGVEVGTENAWDLCDDLDLPRMVLINKMDRENADFVRALASIQETLGKHCVAISAPVGAQQDFQGVISLLDPPEDAPASVTAEVEEYRERLIEAVAETSDEMATKYLEGEALSREEIVAALKQGILQGKLVPVMVGSATTPLGMTEVMDAIVDLMPSPSEAPDAEATTAGSEGTTMLAADPAGPLAALVFKTTADQFVGKLSYFRVVSGTVSSDSHVWNANKAQAERIGQVFVPRGKNQEPVGSLVAGDIGAVPKLSATNTGDTLAQRETPLMLKSISFTEPIFIASISPKGKADLDKMANALNRLVEEDPTLLLTREQLTGEVLLAALGETHAEVAMEKAKRKFGVELVTSLPKVAYQETIGGTIKTEYKHKKQTGGHGQYGHVKIELEPRPRGSGFEFVEKVVGGNVPKEYIPAVEKGVLKSLQEGALAGFPIVDLRVLLYDGSSHPVDSSGMAFEIAGSYALRKGVIEANPVLLEPVMRIQVTVPDSYTGEVIGDLNTKRARILGMTPEGGMTVIEADVPQTEVRRYATELRSMSQGRGRFKMEFGHYEEVPQHLTQRIVEETQKEKAGPA